MPATRPPRKGRGGSRHKWRLYTRGGRAIRCSPLKRAFTAIPHAFFRSPNLLLTTNYEKQTPISRVYTVAQNSRLQIATESRTFAPAKQSFAAGHCELANGVLSMSVEHGKARDRAIIAAFRKHPVFKAYELKLELNEKDSDEEEIDQLEKEMDAVKPQDKNSREAFAQIKKALDEYKIIGAHDFDLRQKSQNVVKNLIQIWRKDHAKSQTKEDLAIEAQLKKIEQWFADHSKKEAAEKDHAEGYNLLDKYVKYRDLIKNVTAENYPALLQKLQTLQPLIVNWLPAHAEAAKTDKTTQTQYQHLSAALSNIPKAIQFLQNGIQKLQQNQNNTKKAVLKHKNAVPSTATFLKNANLKAGENAELDSIIGKMERMEDNYEDGPALSVQIETMLKNGITNFAEFQDLYDDHENRLYSLRNEIQAFLAKNKGLFKNISPAQKKRTNALQTLLARVQQEINSIGSILFEAKMKLQSSEALMDNEETAAVAESLAMASGESTMLITEAMKILKKGEHGTANSPGLNRWLAMLEKQELNVQGNADTQLYQLYQALGNKPTQQQLDTLLSKGGQADQLIEKISKTLDIDYTANAATDERMQLTGVISQYAQLNSMPKLLYKVESAGYDDVADIVEEYQENQKFYQAHKDRLEKMPDNHPQYTEHQQIVQAFEMLDNTLQRSYKRLLQIKAEADAVAKKSVGFELEMLVNAPNSDVSKMFKAFAKSELSAENVDAYQNLMGSMQRHIFAQQYLIPDDALNISRTCSEMLISEANKLNPPVPHVDHSTISNDEYKIILAPNGAIANKLIKELKINLSDTYSRFCILSARELFNAAI